MRPGERAVALPEAKDAGLVFIGRIRTPWATRAECPRQGATDGPECRIEVFAPWAEALEGLADHERIEVVYWLHQARRDLVLQSPRHDGKPRGAFALRSPVRPNPLATSLVRLVAVEGLVLVVRGLDCLDGTPLLDLKPDRCAFSPPASAGGLPALATLDEVRAEIDAVDDALVALLRRRLSAIRRAAEIKAGPGDALVEWRVEQVAERVRAAAQAVGFDADAAERIWRSMMEECIAFERRRLAARAGP
jgi:tRNA-Thr(GGU) m(6)t(6)A37 methyltransferase TsaA